MDIPRSTLGRGRREEGSAPPGLSSDLLRDANQALLLSSIRQHELAEQALAAEAVAARLAAIVTSSDDAIISKDLSGVIQSWNMGAQRMFGYTAAEAIGRPATLLIPEDHADEEPEILARISRGESIDHYETVRRRKDGSLLHVSLTISPVRGAGGRVIGAASIARDITERKQSEGALRRAEVQLQAELADSNLLRELSTAMAEPGTFEALCDRVMDSAVAIMRSDFASMQMFFPQRGDHGELLLLAQRGFNPEGVKYWKWVALHTGSTCGEAYRTLARSHVVDVEKCPFMQGDDLAGYLNMGMHAAQTTPLISRAGVLIGMISTHWKKPHQPTERDFKMFDVLARHAADLIERAQAEQALRESEARFRTLADSMPQIVWTARPDGAFEYFNQRWYEYTGFAPGDLTWEQVLHPADAKCVAEALARCIRDGAPFDAECRYQDRTTGGYRWFVVRALPLRNGEGEIVRWFGTSTDIDDQKRAEELVHANNQMLQQAVKARDQVLAFVAHDLKNPLLAIEMTTTTMGDPAETPADRAESVELIQRCTRDMKRLIGDLLDVSRLEAGRFPIKPARIEPGALCKEALELFGPRAKAAGVALECDIPAEVPAVSADRAQITRVLSNLLANAIKFTAKAKPAPGGRVTVSARPAAAGVEFAVSDTGPGIAPADLPHIFDRFWQADRGGIGAGLGLAICKGIAEAHGGQIRAESTPGSGATIRFTLPTAPSVP